MGRKKKQDAPDVAVSHESKFIVFNNNQRAVRKANIMDVAKAKGLFGYSIILRGIKMSAVAVDYDTQDERDSDFDLIVSLLNE